MAVSLNPDDATQDSGTRYAEDVTVMDAWTEMTDYDGHVDPPVPALVIKVRNKSGRYFDRIYSAGKDVIPSKDATGFDPVGLEGGLAPGCNTVLVLRSFVEHGGVPAADLALGDVSILKGLQVKMAEVLQMPGKPRAKRDARGQVVKDAQGRTVTEPSPERYVRLVIGTWTKQAAAPPAARGRTPIPLEHPDVVPNNDPITDDDLPF